jgi:hypothetical protein
LVYFVTADERCEREGVALLVATTRSDLLAPVVLVAEFVELTIRKPITTTTTTTTTREQSYFFRYLVVKIKVS